MSEQHVEKIQKIIDSLETIRVNIEALHESGAPMTEDIKNANNLCKAAAVFVINYVNNTATK